MNVVSNGPSWESKARDEPGGSEAEHEVETHRNGHDGQRQPDRMPGVTVVDQVRHVSRQPTLERLHEDEDQWDDDENADHARRPCR